MPYLWVGNAKDLFIALGKEDIIASSATDNTVNNKEIFYKDVPRTPFLGTKNQAESYYKIWTKYFAPEFYVQGSMTAGLLASLFRDQPLMTEQEINDGDFEAYSSNRVMKQFAFLDAKKRPCGLMLIYRRDDPSQWIVGFMRNGHLEHSKREVCILSSSNLAAEHAYFALTAVEVPLFENKLMNEVTNTRAADVLQGIFNKDTGNISAQSDNLSFILRTLNTEYGTAVINDPIDFAEMDLECLFHDNLALALLREYTNTTEISLTYNLLQECLTANSVLRKRIESVNFFSENKQVRRSILQMIIVFYEHGSLDSSAVQLLLNDTNFIENFAGMMSNKTKLLLLPFMREKGYNEDLIKAILFEEAYYTALSMVLELGEAYTVDVPELFQDPRKRQQLQYINDFKDPECKKLCYIFWIKGNLTLDGYKLIAEKAKQYPLMPLALIHQVKEGHFPDASALEQVALHPEERLKDIIKYSFFANRSVPGLKELSSNDVEEAHRALNVLKSSSWDTDYHLVVSNDKNGIALRLLLPQLEQIHVPLERKQLIAIFFKGVKEGINAQYDMITALKKDELQKLAQEVHEQFKAVVNLLDMDCLEEAVFAAQYQNAKAECFRKTKKRIDEQCQRISQYLAIDAAQGESEQDRRRAWDANVLTYRKELYKIACEALTAKPGTPEAHPLYVAEKIKNKEKEILETIDPHTTFLRKLIVALANLVIFCVSLAVAHVIHYKYTDDVLFFTRSKVGGALHEMSRGMEQEISCVIAPGKSCS